jgi:hypothetical protein
LKATRSVASYCDGSTAFGFDVGDNTVRTLFAGGVVHYYRGTRRAQALGDRRTDTF